MDKKDWLTLYKLMRMVYLEGSCTKDAFHGLSHHLLGPDKRGYYFGLVTYLAEYGTRYVLPEVKKYLHERYPEPPSAIVDIGSGLEWLRLALDVPYYPIDKRPWTPQTILIDIEKEEEFHKLDKVLLAAGSTPLIVMCDTLHCLGNLGVLKHMAPRDLLVVEFIGLDNDDYNIYVGQLSGMNVTIITKKAFLQALHDAGYSDFHIKSIGGHLLILARGGNNVSRIRGSFAWPILPEGSKEAGWRY